jgi:hypothetical protein
VKGRAWHEVKDLTIAALVKDDRFFPWKKVNVDFSPLRYEKSLNKSFDR